MSITRRAAMLASATLAMPWVARAATTMKFGLSSPVTGSAAESGRFQRTGAQLAVDELNVKGVLGRQVELVIEDDQTTNPGAVLAFSRLSADADMVGFIGSIRSTQVNAVAPDVLKVGKPFMIGGTDPTLTHMGNRWLFRCRPNDSYSAKVIAQFGIKDAEEDEMGGREQHRRLRQQRRMKAVADEPEGAGCRAGADAGLHQPAIGLHPGLPGGAVSRGRTCWAPTSRSRPISACSPGSCGSSACGSRGSGRRPSPTSTALNLGGRSLYGTYGVADYAVDANPEAKAYAAKYEAKTQGAAGQPVLLGL